MVGKLGCACVTLVLAAAGARAGQNVVVVLDNSSSMNIRLRSNQSVSKMDAAKLALLAVLDKLPPEARVGVVLLNGRWKPDEWICPLGPVDRQRLHQAVPAIKAQGATPLGACMKVGADALLALRAKDYYGSYRLLIVTDGEATDHSLVERYLPDILSRGIWVDVIGVDMASRHSLATKVHTYRRADDPQSLEQAIAAVFAESTGGGRDAAESDFEVIAAIPTPMADAALKALAQSGNQPIGQRPLPVAAPGAGPQSVQPPAGPALPPRPATVPAAPQRATSVLSRIAFGGLCCLVGVFFAIVVIVGLVSSSKRSR